MRKMKKDILSEFNKNKFFLCKQKKKILHLLSIVFILIFYSFTFIVFNKIINSNSEF